MILYRDFVPARTRGGFLRSDRFESFDQAVSAANEWVQREAVSVVTVETVVLPNIFREGEEGTHDAQLETAESNTSSNAWHQFVRIWYKASGAEGA
jgi:hypothetical protein